ncbi:Heavy metal-associated isoprenylated plant protein 20 [Dichanthelium oligosanthes]|uniref:Heavy metal-associated isoprenylated plant protein 20 n=1 Tax=Dichanthelium oligosanthes TaxID=888268 RepID=A0A1E5WC09_9POAL|nr:Heavy metal-associated isoprenylated plant protein 20 [Dichanthelium oligosanthes]
MGGTLEYLSGLLGGSGGHGHEMKKRKQLQTVELKVRMDCEGCELKVRSALSSMKGVESVEINRKQQKVTVVGYVEASKVLKKAQSTGKKAEMWPYVPYSLVSQPYVAGTYDKRAPPGYVRSAEPGYVVTAGSQQQQQQQQQVVGRPHDHLTDMFNDENPNSCSVM